MKETPRFVISLLVVSLLAVGGITGAILPVDASPDTTISISPGSQTVGVGQTFTIDVVVNPDQPIKGVQCFLTFDPSILKATQVSEGDFFEGYSSFFIPGNIDNTSGEVRGIAATILGSGSTSSSGTFATVTFEAIASGSTAIAFNMSDGNTVVVNGTGDAVAPSPSDGTVTVSEEPNDPPSCSVSASPTAGVPPLDVTFSLSASDPDGSIDSWELDIDDDGTPEYSGSGMPPASQMHTYSSVGTYTARLTVVDDDSAVDEDTATVTVSEEPNDPPSCTVSASPTAGVPPLDVTFSLSASDPDGSIDSWELDIDDDGTPEYSGSGMPPASQLHTYSSVGTYTARLTVVDDDSAVDEDTATVTVSEEDPVPPEIREVSVSPSPTAEAGENVVITANVTDDMNLADVRLVLTLPDDSTRNFSILQNVSGIDGTTYYCQQPYYDLGEYTFHIYAVDGAGNGNTSAEQSFTVEDTMPPAFSNVAATPSVANYNGAVNVSARIIDAVTVEDVFLKIIDPDDEVTNTSIIGQVVDNDTYYSETTYTMLGTYEYVFYAVDGEGNGNTSSTKTFRVKDVTPPVVTLTAPNGGENLTGDVDITWNATDVATANDSELKVTLKYSADGGVSWQTIVTDTANDGSYEWDTDGLDDGVEYLIKISVSDPSNNEGTDLSDDEFTVDNTAPTLTLEKPTTNHLYLFDREILPILRDKAVIVGQITVGVTATDATSGMDRVSFLVDGVEKASDETTPYEWVWDDTALFAHTLKVVAYDHAGNRAERSVSVTVYNI